MPHTHHCEVCKIAVAVCSDEACQGDPPEDGQPHPNAGEHYCSIHHPEDEHKIVPALPLSRFNITVQK